MNIAENGGKELNLEVRDTAKPYPLAVSAAGVGLCCLSILFFRLEQVEWPFLLMALFTTVSINRASIQFPPVARWVPLSRMFTYLAILLFDPAATVLLAFADGICCSLRATKKPLIVLFHGAATVLPTVLIVYVFQFGIGTIGDPSHHSFGFLIAIALLGAVGHSAHSKLLVGPPAFKGDPLFRAARARLPRVDPIAAFLSAPVAGVIAMLIGTNGFVAIISFTPIIAAVLYILFGSLIVRKTLNASTFEAEQAKRHLIEVKESEELYRNAFDHAPIGMGLVTQTGEWLQVNSSL